MLVVRKILGPTLQLQDNYNQINNKTPALIDLRLNLLHTSTNINDNINTNSHDSRLSESL
jgi:hypothetical protein